MSTLQYQRTTAGVEVSEVARKMGIPAKSVVHIERTELRFLEVDTLQSYLAALGLQLELVAVGKDGNRKTITMARKLRIERKTQ